jgi:hypothetical protein
VKKLLERSTVRKCEHEDTIASITSGIQRVVCQTCGHVSLVLVDNDVTDIRRPEAPEEATA